MPTAKVPHSRHRHGCWAIRSSRARGKWTLSRSGAPGDYKNGSEVPSASDAYSSLEHLDTFDDFSSMHLRAVHQRGISILCTSFSKTLPSRTNVYGLRCQGKMQHSLTICALTLHHGCVSRTHAGVCPGTSCLQAPVFRVKNTNYTQRQPEGRHYCCSRKSCMRLAWSGCCKAPIHVRFHPPSQQNIPYW